MQPDPRGIVRVDALADVTSSAHSLARSLARTHDPSPGIRTSHSGLATSLMTIRASRCSQ